MAPALSWGAVGEMGQWGVGYDDISGRGRPGLRLRLRTRCVGVGLGIEHGFPSVENARDVPGGGFRVRRLDRRGWAAKVVITWVAALRHCPTDCRDGMPRDGLQLAGGRSYRIGVPSPLPRVGEPNVF